MGNSSEKNIELKNDYDQIIVDLFNARLGITMKTYQVGAIEKLFHIYCDDNKNFSKLSLKDELMGCDLIVGKQVEPTSINIEQAKEEEQPKKELKPKDQDIETFLKDTFLIQHGRLMSKMEPGTFIYKC